MFATLLELFGVLLIGTGFVVAFGVAGVGIAVGALALLAGLYLEGDGS